MGRKLETWKEPIKTNVDGQTLLHDMCCNAITL